jgi:polyhydroxyalkanoate synthesis regulator phasin
MPGFGHLVQKAFYLGVGLASYAGEKAGTQFQELRKQAQLLADEMVKRGELQAEEAGKFVDDLIQQAQRTSVTDGQDPTPPPPPSGPRPIEILDAEEDDPNDPHTEHLRQQVQALQDELRRLQNLD